MELRSRAEFELTGRRIRAAWIDIAVLTAIFIVLAILNGTARVGTTSTVPGEHAHGFSFTLGPGLFGVYLLLVFFYYFVPEAMTGQTLGKRITNVRVVTVDGTHPSRRAVALRTVARYVDFLPVFYFFGWLALKRDLEPPQRLGDSLARTTVTFSRST